MPTHFAVGSTGSGTMKHGVRAFKNKKHFFLNSVNFQKMYTRLNNLCVYQHFVRFKPGKQWKM